MPNYPQLLLDASPTTFYATNLYSGSDADLDNTAPVDDTDGYTANIALTAKTGVNLNFKFDASGATDNLILKIFRNNTSTWDGDEILIDEIEVDNDGSEDIYSYVIDALQYGAGHYRFSMQSEGANDTFDMEVKGYYWRFEIATS